jgi:hypothetical protein
MSSSKSLLLIEDDRHLRAAVGEMPGAFSAAFEEREEAARLEIGFAIPKPVQLLEPLDSVVERCDTRAGVQWALGGRCPALPERNLLV